VFRKYFHLKSEKQSRGARRASAKANPNGSTVNTTWIEDETKSARLGKIASLTLDYYNEQAEEFWHGTRDHDVKQNIAALLQKIEGKAPFTILDFCCGPGRDLKVFSELGHIAVGLEGAAHFAEMRAAPSRN
jgi:2-polyprenyl-3-methyl-5-hydroxy-6-metoxy-1,4-benzoquinol methylase